MCAFLTYFFMAGYQYRQAYAVIQKVVSSNYCSDTSNVVFAYIAIYIQVSPLQAPLNS